MKTLTIIRDIALIALLAALGFAVITVARTVNEIPARIDTRVAAIQDDVIGEAMALNLQIAKLRTDALKEIDKQASGIRYDATGQLTALRTDTLARADALISDANDQAGRALDIADRRIGDGVYQIEQIRKDVKPSLDGAAALEKDAKDSWDSNYYDVASLLDSAEVTTTSIAQTSEAIRDAAPKLTASISGVATSADGIAADVKREADDLTKPQTFWAQFRMWLLAAARIVGAL
jgi:hypothetical protein